MTADGWTGWKLVGVGMALVIVTALLTGLVVVNWAATEAQPTATMARESPDPSSGCNNSASPTVEPARSIARIERRPAAPSRPPTAARPPRRASELLEQERSAETALEAAPAAEGSATARGTLPARRVTAGPSEPSRTRPALNESP